MKIDNYKNLIEDNEKIVKTFVPKSFLRRLSYFLRKRVALIITNERILYRGNFRYLDKNIRVGEISDVFLTNEFSTAVLAGKSLEILKKGASPIDNSVLGKLISNDVMSPIYRGYISVGWLSRSQKQEAFVLIKKLIETK